MSFLHTYNLMFFPKKPKKDKEARVAIPASLRLAVLKKFYDFPISCHLGCGKMFSRVPNACYFPKLREFCKRCIEICVVCERFNCQNQLPGGFISSISVKMPLQIGGRDLIWSYPSSEHHCKYSSVTVEYFSKWLELIPLRLPQSQWPLQFWKIL